MVATQRARRVSPRNVAIFLPTFLGALALGADAQATPAYVRSDVGQPWGVNTNEQAMDLVFGGGGWDDLRFETVNPAELFSPSVEFIYLEGSDSNAQELEAFLGANQPALEAWVAAGGGLFLNAAPNEGGNQNWGFGGVTLSYPDFSNNPGSAADPGHAIWNGPYLPTAPALFTGNSFAHATVSGPGLIAHIFDVDGGSPNLAELSFGAGLVMFGGLTTTNFWEPAVESANLRANIIAYLGGGGQTAIAINEIRIDQTAVDNDEYIEIAGPPGASLDGLSYLVIGDLPTGVIEAVVDLDGLVIPPSGYLVIAEGTFTLGVADLVTNLNFENGDTNTHLLVSGFVGSLGNNLDVDADGVLDSTPWSGVVDVLAIVDNDDADLPYGPGASCIASPSCNELTIAANPDHVFRCGDLDGTWNQGRLDVLAVPASDSPGGPNPCACGDGYLLPTEECDDAGESAVCDDDCTFATCGDALINIAAGEICDDAGESALCNLDCTLAVCGDGTTNMAAGEECDDFGESAGCDVDCTEPLCGDLVINVTAGETCDDGGRSATCNSDCTVASCGDGIFNAAAGEQCDGDGIGGPGETATCDVDCTLSMCGDTEINATAGEACDDGNNDDGDGCAADCTMEIDPGTTGGSTTDGSTGDESSSGAATASTGDDSGTTGGPDSTSGDATDTGTEASDTADTSAGPSSISDTAGNDSSDTGSGGAGVLDDDGCGCSSASGPGRGAALSMFAMFGVGALRRRRR